MALGLAGRRRRRAGLQGPQPHCPPLDQMAATVRNWLRGAGFLIDAFRPGQGRGR